MKEFKVGFTYIYRNDKLELISGLLHHITRQGDRFWCKETDPHGNSVEHNYNNKQLDKISS